MRYDDDVWYAGTLTEFNTATGEWVARFDIDDEMTYISFPDKDVRLL